MRSPLYDMLGRSPEFFSVHRAEPVQIIGIVLLLSLGTGLLLSLVEFSSQVFGKKARQIVHSGQVFLLAALTVAPLAKRWIIDSDAIFSVAIATVALGFTVAYTRYELPRLFLTTLSPAVLFFPLWFVFATPVAGLVFPKYWGAIR